MTAENEQANDLQAIILRSLELGTQIAGVVVVAVLGGLFLGRWIDRELGSSPWATLLLLGLGTLVAMIGCYRAMASAVANLATGQKIVWGESLRPLAFVARVGLVIIVPLLVGLFLGQSVDGWSDTRPWMTLVLTMVGVVAGLVGVWRLSSTYLKRMTKGNREESL
jgi:F0F1-type ATP synthase assembly protein I